jgi:CheY-like chemotaxis protein
MVLDLHLPDILGLQVLSELRSARIALPIVVVTGWYFDDGRKEACLAMGAGAFLQKPLDDSVLAAALRLVIAAQAIPTPPLACAPTDGGGSVHPQQSMEVRADDGDALRVYHDRAVSGDDTAAERIVATLLPSLQQRLRKAFPTTPKDWIYDAVVDALREYHARPARFDVSRGTPLSQFLLFAARRNVLDRRDAEARRRGRETIVPSDTLAELAGAAPEMLPAECSTTIAVPEGDFTEAERSVLHLWRAGERRTRVYAEALGLGSLPLAEQRVHVKRLKDRVVQRVRRCARGGEGV